MRWPAERGGAVRRRQRDLRDQQLERRQPRHRGELRWRCRQCRLDQQHLAAGHQHRLRRGQRRAGQRRRPWRSASSVFSAQFPVAAVNNNERKGAGWGSGGGWNDATANAFPDWVEIDFNGSKTIDRVIVYTLQDNYPNPIEPTDTPDLRPVRGDRLQRAGLDRQRLDDAGHRQRQQPGQARGDLPAPSPPVASGST